MGKAAEVPPRCVRELRVDAAELQIRFAICGMVLGYRAATGPSAPDKGSPKT